MELYKRISMKDMLAQTLYLLMKEIPFDKITIKQISAKTGVIRGTFYNHFYDKLEALEYLTYTILLDSKSYNGKISDYNSLLKEILKSIEKEKEFFQHCFQVEGQNGFESILTNVFYQLISNYIEMQKINFEDNRLDKELFIQINVNTIVFVIKTWMTKKYNKNSDEIYALFELILSKSSKDIIEELKQTQQL